MMRGWRECGGCRGGKGGREAGDAKDKGDAGKHGGRAEVKGKGIEIRYV